MNENFIQLIISFNLFCKKIAVCRFCSLAPIVVLVLHVFIYNCQQWWFCSYFSHWLVDTFLIAVKSVPFQQVGFTTARLTCFLFVFSTQLLVIATRLGSVSRTSVSLEMSALRLTCFLPAACWDWLAAYRDPQQNKLYKKLMDGNHNSEILVFSIQTSKGRKMGKKTWGC